MIYIQYHKQQKVILTSFRESITDKDIDFYDETLGNIHLLLEHGIKLDVIVDLKSSIVINKSVTNKLAVHTERYKGTTNHIYVANMSAFIRIMYKVYLSLTTQVVPHFALNEDEFYDLCEKLKIPKPNMEEPWNSIGYLSKTPS